MTVTLDANPHDVERATIIDVMRVDGLVVSPLPSPDFRMVF